MTYYTRQILGSDGQKRTYVFCDLPDGGTKSFVSDPDNTDYQAYLKWVAEGNTPLPAEGTE